MRWPLPRFLPWRRGLARPQTPTAPAADLPGAPEQRANEGAWAQLPPIQRALSALGLTADSLSFVHDLPGVDRPETALQPLAHERSNVAPAGLADLAVWQVKTFAGDEELRLRSPVFRSVRHRDESSWPAGPGSKPDAHGDDKPSLADEATSIDIEADPASAAATAAPNAALPPAFPPRHVPSVLPSTEPPMLAAQLTVAPEPAMLAARLTVSTEPPMLGTRLTVAPEPLLKRPSRDLAAGPSGGAARDPGVTEANRLPAGGPLVETARVNLGQSRRLGLGAPLAVSAQRRDAAAPEPGFVPTRPSQRAAKLTPPEPPRSASKPGGSSTADSATLPPAKVPPIFRVQRRSEPPAATPAAAKPVPTSPIEARPAEATAEPALVAQPPPGDAPVSVQPVPLAGDPVLLKPDVQFVVDTMTAPIRFLSATGGPDWKAAPRSERARTLPAAGAPLVGARGLLPGPLIQRVAAPPSPSSPADPEPPPELPLALPSEWQATGGASGEATAAAPAPPAGSVPGLPSLATVQRSAPASVRALTLARPVQASRGTLGQELTPEAPWAPAVPAVPAVQLAAERSHAWPPAPMIQRAEDSAPALAATQAPSAAGGHTDHELDDLAHRLYDRLRARLRAELLIDRERAGLITDLS